MFQTAPRQINCPNCRQPFNASIEQIVDGGRDPNSKARLLSGRLNAFRCPFCGYEFRVSTPIIYHDASKELLLVNVPMEMGLPEMEQQQLIGSLLNVLTRSIPQEQQKGYLLMPRPTLTVQGMIETILEKDGITKEMLEARRAKLALAEQFLQSDPNTWEALAAQNDAAMDEDFFAILTASAQAAMQSGRVDVAQSMLGVRDRLLSLSTKGRELMAEANKHESRIQDVANDLNAVGSSLTRESLLNLAIRYAESDEMDKIDVLVGLARPAMDYQFFALLTEHIEAASADDKTRLEALRTRLLQLSEAMDAEAQSVAQTAVNALQAILDSEDLDSAIAANAAAIDDTFLSVLSANIQNAERTGNQAAAARLREIMDKVMGLLQQSAPPSIQFINDLLTQPTFEAAKQLIRDEGAQYGEELIAVMEALISELSARGSRGAVERLLALREAAAEILGNSPAAPTGGGIKLQPAGNTIQFPGAGQSAPPTSDKSGGSGIVLPFSARKKGQE
ncbi:MAG: CpXC domain-containing protein [Anaerolineae bacterium]